jgi:hypothetical protein
MDFPDTSSPSVEQERKIVEIFAHHTSRTFEAAKWFNIASKISPFYRRKAWAIMLFAVICPANFCIFMDDDLFVQSRMSFSWPKQSANFLEVASNYLAVNPWSKPLFNPRTRCGRSIIRSRLNHSTPSLKNEVGDGMKVMSFHKSYYSERALLYIPERIITFLNDVAPSRVRYSTGKHCKLFHCDYISFEDHFQFAIHNSSWESALIYHPSHFVIHPPYGPKEQSRLFGKNCGNRERIWNILKRGCHPKHTEDSACTDMAVNDWLSFFNVAGTSCPYNEITA